MDPLRLPVDDDELLALVAPRPTLVIAPTHDRYTHLDAVKRAVGQREGLRLETPVDFNRFSPALQRMDAEWLAANR